MKTKFCFLIVFFSFILLLSGCEEKKERVIQEEKTEEVKVVEKKSTEPTITIKIEKITTLNTENFIQVYLSRMEHELKWMVALQKQVQGKEFSETTPDSAEARILMDTKEKMAQEFFQNWGISVKEFEEFAQNNEEAIQKYIDENQEVQDFIDKIQEMNMAFYNMQGDLDDDNFDED